MMTCISTWVRTHGVKYKWCDTLYLKGSEYNVSLWRGCRLDKKARGGGMKMPHRKPNASTSSCGGATRQFLWELLVGSWWRDSWPSLVAPDRQMDKRTWEPLSRVWRLVDRRRVDIVPADNSMTRFARCSISVHGAHLRYSNVGSTQATKWRLWGHEPLWHRVSLD